MRLHIMNHFKTDKNFVLGTNLLNTMAVPSASVEAFEKSEALSLLKLKNSYFRVSDIDHVTVFKNDAELFVDIPQGASKNDVIDSVMNFLEKEDRSLIARILHFIGRIILGAEKYEKIRLGIVTLIGILFDRVIFSDRHDAITHVFERGFLDDINKLAAYESTQGVILSKERLRLGGESLLPGMDGFTKFASSMDVESVHNYRPELVSV